MIENYYIGMRLRLVSLNGIATAPAGAKFPSYENYWLLIGQKCTVVKTEPTKHISPDRVLVRFDISVTGLGLECHNEIENSLWLRKGDLELAV